MAVLLSIHCKLEDFVAVYIDANDVNASVFIDLGLQFERRDELGDHLEVHYRNQVVN